MYINVNLGTIENLNIFQIIFLLDTVKACPSWPRQSCPDQEGCI